MNPSGAMTAAQAIRRECRFCIGAAQANCTTAVCKLHPDVFKFRSSVKRIRAHCLDCAAQDIHETKHEAVATCDGHLPAKTGTPSGGQTRTEWSVGSASSIPTGSGRTLEGQSTPYPPSGNHPRPPPEGRNRLQGRRSRRGWGRGGAGGYDGEYSPRLVPCLLGTHRAEAPALKEPIVLRNLSGNGGGSGATRPTWRRGQLRRSDTGRGGPGGDASPSPSVPPLWRPGVPARRTPARETSPAPRSRWGPAGGRRSSGEGRSTGGPGDRDGDRRLPPRLVPGLPRVHRIAARPLVGPILSRWPCGRRESGDAARPAQRPQSRGLLRSCLAGRKRRRRRGTSSRSPAYGVMSISKIHRRRQRRNSSGTSLCGRRTSTHPAGDGIFTGNSRNPSGGSVSPRWRRSSAASPASSKATWGAPRPPTSSVPWGC